MKPFDVRFSIDFAERDAVYHLLQNQIGARIKDTMVSETGTVYFTVEFKPKSAEGNTEQIRNFLNSGQFSSLQRHISADRDLEFKKVSGYEAVQAVFKVDRADAPEVLRKLEQEFGDLGCAIGSHDLEHSSKTRIDIIFAKSSPAEVDYHIHDALGAATLEGFSAAVVDDIDWVAESLKGLPVIRTNRFMICGDHNYPARSSGAIPIKIPAAEAFGTGHHGTTIGCLDAIDMVCKIKRPRAILDVGTGSGILGIAAAKLVRCPVVGTDIDERAVRIANQNALDNDVGHLFFALTASGTHAKAVRQNGPYDLVIANILAKPLIKMAGDLVDQLTSSGVIILSGLLHHQAREVFARFNLEGLYRVRHLKHDEWSTLILSK